MDTGPLPDSNSAPPRVSRTARIFLLALAYLAMTLALSWPLLLHFRSFVIAGLEDGAMSVWNVWWMKYSIFHLEQSPLHTSSLFWPDGSSLSFHSLPKMLGLMSVPLQYLAGLTVAYNVIFLLTFVVTGLTTYWLALHLIGRRLPAFMAGAFFALCPFRWDQESHLQLLCTMLMPVFILLVMRGRESLTGGGRRPWIYFSLAGLALAGTAYDTEYYTIFLLLFAALFFVFYVPLGRDRRSFYIWFKLMLGLLLAGAVLLVTFAPILLAAARELGENGDYVSFPANQTVFYSADLISFFVPHAHSLYLGSSFDFVSRNVVVTDATFLGWLPVALALAGIWRFRRVREFWLWVTGALFFAALALGPFVTVNGVVRNLHGPYWLITKLPVLSSARVPARFGVMTALAVAILAGYGCAALFGWLEKPGRFRGVSGGPAGWTGIAVPVAAALILLGMFLEFRPYIDMTSTTMPPVYADIAASGDTGSVVTLPLGWEAGNDTTGIERTYTQLFATVHEMPMVGGMLARTPKDRLFGGVYAPVIDFLANPVLLQPSDLDRDPGAIERFRERYDVAFIVAHKQPPEVYFYGQYLRFTPNMTPEALDRVDKYVTAYLDMEKFAETDEIVAYRRK
jgi:hypothetical protein